MKKNIKLIFSVLFIIVFIMAICFLYKQNNNMKKFISDAILECQQRDICLFEKAIENKNITLCFEIKNNETKSDCIRNIARERNDLSLCEKIDSSNLADKDYCYFDLAYKRQYKNICNSIKILDKNECINCASGVTEEALCLPLNRVPEFLLEKDSENVNLLDKKYIDIAAVPVEAEIKNVFKEWASEYKINRINFVADRNTAVGNEYYADSFVSNDSKDAFIVSVDFSIKCAENEMNCIAGNGEIGLDGWMLNKSLFLKVDKNSEGSYFAYIMGTGL